MDQIARVNPDQECSLLVRKNGTHRISLGSSGKLVALISQPNLRNLNTAFIWHNHPASSDVHRLSPQDVQVSRQLNTAIAMTHSGSGFTDFYSPRSEDIKPYTGREFDWVYGHCWDLVCDYYLAEFGFKLKRFRLEHPDEWEEMNHSPFLAPNGLRARGFFQVQEQTSISTYEPLKGDVLVLGSDETATHCGVIQMNLPSGKPSLLHQLSHGRSISAIYERALRKITHSVWQLRPIDS